MSTKEYAELQTQLGFRIVQRNGCFWRQVRPFFFRPLLLIEEQEESRLQPPCGWPGGYQYVLPNAQRANSAMNFIILDCLGEYSLAKLGHRRRNLIHSAARQFQVRPIRDLQELKEQGYRIYLSFYQRTGYSYRSDRKDKAAFDTWADTLFKHPKALLLGGYGPDGLVAVSSSYWTNNTLVYASLFCETESMRKNIGELMFHELRRLAAEQPGIGQIHVRNYQGGNSLDRYYLFRGCKVVRKPARLEISRATQALIKWFLPAQHSLLQGEE